MPFRVASMSLMSAARCSTLALIFGVLLLISVIGSFSGGFALALPLHLALPYPVGGYCCGAQLGNCTAGGPLQVVEASFAESGTWRPDGKKYPTFNVSFILEDSNGETGKKAEALGCDFEAFQLVDNTSLYVFGFETAQDCLGQLAKKFRIDPSKLSLTWNRVPDEIEVRIGSRTVLYLNRSCTDKQ